MISFPNAKINLGLDVISRRSDGFHNISSVFLPVDWKDALEIVPAAETTFESYGIHIPGNPDSNLCLKAYHLLAKDYPMPTVRIILEKIIPIGAGLGGGSADASFTLKLLNEQFDLQLEEAALESYAARLGSDCPFFIKNQPILATGTGITFESVNVDLLGYQILLVNPNIHIGTAEAYAGISPRVPELSVKEIIENYEIKAWKGLLKNDFEASIFPNHPEISKLKEDMYKAGAVYASMSGSGATVYGIFEGDQKIEQIKEGFSDSYLKHSSLL
ncbi:4-(cytidine 5'-diphospho)-2-C-methyl-D-erythritol kinase [Persicobacter diffluens]|uniref:4-diphosphocytidyl-2-C-methyl-D-erythritol kinase n=1 Tax=Persicobacter diffluens TaxID=981 RepID=A0AAN4VTH8_9BACT|nr:4-diphosphocytidyl-2-C-methyl-D-erythritol kinase [Persicobacter diffluens]